MQESSVTTTYRGSSQGIGRRGRGENSAPKKEESALRAVEN